MKHKLFSFFILLLTCTYVHGQWYDGLYDNIHDTGAQQQGIVVLKDGKVSLWACASVKEEVTDGLAYYRVYHWPMAEFATDYAHPAYGFGPEAINDWECFYQKSDLGYRFADEKMYLYDFASKKETLALDFSLQPGGHFTTPDGTEWEVVSREKRTFETCNSGHIEYKEDHTVLEVLSVDGQKSDEWIDHVGAVRFPLLLMGQEGIEKAHVGFMSYSPGSAYLFLEFGDDPLYGSYIGRVKKPNTDPTDPDYNPNAPGGKPYQSVDINLSGNELQLNAYLWCVYSDYYAFAYRDGKNFLVNACTVGDAIDAGPEDCTCDILFPNIPTQAEGCTATMLFGEKKGQGETSIASPNAWQSHTMNGEAYDLLGRKLTRKPEKGLYIENGHTRISK